MAVSADWGGAILPCRSSKGPTNLGSKLRPLIPNREVLGGLGLRPLIFGNSHISHCGIRAHKPISGMVLGPIQFHVGSLSAPSGSFS